MLNKLIGIKELYKLLNLYILNIMIFRLSSPLQLRTHLATFIGGLRPLGTSTDSRRIGRSDPDPLMYTSARLLAG